MRIRAGAQLKCGLGIVNCVTTLHEEVRRVHSTYLNCVKTSNEDVTRCRCENAYGPAMPLVQSFLGHSEQLKTLLESFSMPGCILRVSGPYRILGAYLESFPLNFEEAHSSRLQRDRRETTDEDSSTLT